MNNTVSFKELAGAHLPELTRFRARCDWSVRLIDQALSTLSERQARPLRQLRKAYVAVIERIERGAYTERDIPRLVRHAVDAINAVTLHLWQPYVPQGMLPSRLEYAPGSRILIVGERPGSIELRTGIPFCDSLAFERSRCAGCSNFAHCYDQDNHGTLRAFGSRCRHQPPLPNERIQLPTVRLRNAGDLLRDLLLEHGMYRIVWPCEPVYEQMLPVCITNVYPVGTQEEPNDEDQERATGDAPLWLLALQALMVDPKVTVLFGRRAAIAANEIAGGRIGPFHSAPVKLAPPFGYALVTYHPVNLLREEDEYARELMQHSIRNALLQAQRIASDDQSWPFFGSDDWFTISQYNESLKHARRDEH